MTKTEARKIYNEKRMFLSEAEKTKFDDLLLVQFQTLPLPFIECLFSYWPIEENSEPDTHLFTGFLKFRNPELKVGYPKSDFNVNGLQAVAVDVDTPFEKHEFNIYEPDSDAIIPPNEIDLIFVPLIICDKKGIRVGYGKGFYDRYFVNCRANCIKIGFSYFEPIDKIADSTEFDVPLNICVTPHNIYVF
ncbi:MAG: 5-formyltetrahydrofolate cyclo-ligase [Bacteroidota bacterium]|nr:5-formyltetrahydrofolate cyclo-ligase [Bacteroidota bacterium]